MPSGQGHRGAHVVVHLYLFGGVLPYFEMTGHPVPVSSLGFKCPDCFIKDEKAIKRQLPKVLLPMIDVPDGGMCGRHS